MMARAMLESFVQQGFLEREGETVRGRVDFDAGTIKLNGRPFQLPALPGMDLDAMKRTMIADGAPEPDAPPADR